MTPTEALKPLTESLRLLNTITIQLQKLTSLIVCECPVCRLALAMITTEISQMEELRCEVVAASRSDNHIAMLAVAERATATASLTSEKIYGYRNLCEQAHLAYDELIGKVLHTVEEGLTDAAQIMATAKNFDPKTAN